MSDSARRALDNGSPARERTALLRRAWRPAARTSLSDHEGRRSEPGHWPRLPARSDGAEPATPSVMVHPVDEREPTVLPVRHDHGGDHGPFKVVTHG